MEKFRQFADPGTGVNPFVPVWSNYRSPWWGKLLKFLIMLPVGLARLILLIFAFAWLLIASLLCSVIPVGAVRYPLQRCFYFLGCRMALTGLGVLSVNTAAADHRRLKCRPPTTETSPGSDARHGVLICVNYQGFTDVLYYGMKVCPTFVFPASDGSPVAYGLLGALRRACSQELSAPVGKSSSLTDILSAAHAGWNGPVVLFAEGAKTNGSSVLVWKERTFKGLSSLEKPQGTILSSVEYSKSGAYTPHHTIGGALVHIWLLCYQPWHSLTATWLSAADVSTAVKGKELAEQVDLARTLVVRMVPNAVSVDVAAEKHGEFLAYWYNSKSRKYTQSKKKA